MAGGAGVVTAELLASGVGDFEQWLDSLPAHREESQRHYDEYEPAEDDVGRLKEVVELRGGTIRVLVVTDGDSGDAWRGVAVMAKISEACGLDLSILPAAGNEDIVEAFPDPYDETGTPTFVFFDKDGNHLGHLVRAPKQVEMDINRALQERFGYDFPLEGPEHDAAVAEYLEGDGRTREKAWRHAQLWEMIDIIAPEIARVRRGTIGPIGILKRS